MAKAFLPACFISASLWSYLPRLPSQFVGGSQIYFECVTFLPVGILGAVTAVHVYYVKRLSVLNNQIGKVLFQCFTIRLFYILLSSVSVGY